MSGRIPRFHAMTEKLLIRLCEALEDIAFNLGDEGAIAGQLYIISELLEEVAPESGERPKRILRTLDVGRD